MLRRGRVLGNRRRGVLVVLAVLSVTLASPAAAGVAARPATHELNSLRKLWKEYPLETQRPSVPSRPSLRPLPRAQVAGPALPIPDRPRGDAAPTVLYLLAAAIAAMLVTLVLIRRTRLLPASVHLLSRGVTMPIFGDRKPDGEEEDRALVSRISRYDDGKTERDTTTTEATTDNTKTDETSDYAALGEHVAAVLEAARGAATKLELEARAVADKVTGEAKAEADAVVENARERAAEIEAEAARRETAAKEEGARIREQAETYARTSRETAETKAADILDRADREAAEQTRATQARLHSLDRNVAETEQRLRQLVGRLRELASSLDELVSTAAHEDQSDATPDEASLTGVLTQSITESRFPANSTETN